MVRIENGCYYPIYYLGLKVRGRNSSIYTTLPDVRMSDLARDEDDSGIDSTASSNSDSISNDSSQSESSDANAGAGGLNPDNSEETAVLIMNPVSATESTTPPPLHVLVVNMKFQDKLTMLMQKGMLWLSTVPMALHLLVTKIASGNPVSKVVNVVFNVFVYLVILAVSASLLFQLRFTEQPPQFFDPNSNLQKMLDLVGNVTGSSDVNCYNCSAWNSNTNGGWVGGWWVGGWCNNLEEGREEREAWSE